MNHLYFGLLERERCSSQMHHFSHYRNLIRTSRDLVEKYECSHLLSGHRCCQDQLFQLYKLVLIVFMSSEVA